MLTMQHVSKLYRKGDQEIKAIDSISLDIPSGDFVSIIGPSGSGKSSLLLMLGGMLSPTSGKVYLDFTSLYEMSQNEIAKLRQKKIGFVFQTFNLIPYLTAIQNVQLPLLLSGASEKEQEEKAHYLLERVKLSDRKQHKPSELSVGQQQRIALARMLANEPSIILADEPTGNLDPEMAQMVMDFLSDLNAEGKTIVMVTHDMQMAKRAKRSISIDHGKIR
ncbi:MAG: ABC transporter ATP-binding protein [Parachlamydia sp.]|nr:ABC transporter ATP-binding protein [Parachlamydia sp.]